MIPDDVVCAALRMIKERTGSPYHGHITPAEMILYLQNPSEAKPTVSPDTLSINIHNIGTHWVTSVYDPHSRHILVYDSLHHIEHYHQVMPQLKLLYGTDSLSRIDFLPVSQQGTDPACGVYAIAFAFSYCLGQNPSEQKYRRLAMRQHLSMCLETNQVLPFPVDQPQLNSSNKQNHNELELENSFEIGGKTKASCRKRKQRYDQCKRDNENAARRSSVYRQRKKIQMREKRRDQVKKDKENAARKISEYRET